MINKTRYLIDNRRVSIRYDLGSWALPCLIAVAPCNLHVQILCFDIDLYWGVAAEDHGLGIISDWD